MIKEIRFSEEFDRAFKRLKKRYRSLSDDVKKLLASLIENPQQGVELYNGMRKVRISFASKVKRKQNPRCLGAGSSPLTENSESCYGGLPL